MNDNEEKDLSIEYVEEEENEYIDDYLDEIDQETGEVIEKKYDDKEMEVDEEQNENEEDIGKFKFIQNLFHLSSISKQMVRYTV